MTRSTYKRSTFPSPSNNPRGRDCRLLSATDLVMKYTIRNHRGGIGHRSPRSYVTFRAIACRDGLLRFGKQYLLSRLLRWRGTTCMHDHCRENGCETYKETAKETIGQLLHGIVEISINRVPRPSPGSTRGTRAHEGSFACRFQRRWMMLHHTGDHQIFSSVDWSIFIHTARTVRRTLDRATY